MHKPSHEMWGVGVVQAGRWGCGSSLSLGWREGLRVFLRVSEGERAALPPCCAFAVWKDSVCPPPLPRGGGGARRRGGGPGL